MLHGGSANRETAAGLQLQHLSLRLKSKLEAFCHFAGLTRAGYQSCRLESACFRCTTYVRASTQLECAQRMGSAARKFFPACGSVGWFCAHNGSVSFSTVGQPVRLPAFLGSDLRPVAVRRLGKGRTCRDWEDVSA